MEERAYNYSFRENILLKEVIVTSLLIFPVLYLLVSKQIALGFALGVSASLLVFWFSWEGLNNLKKISNAQSTNKKRAQRIAIQGYLASYFLLGVVLWLGVNFNYINFYAVASGFLIPQTFLRIYTLLT